MDVEAFGIVVAFGPGGNVRGAQQRWVGDAGQRTAAALISEIARHTPETRTAFTGRLTGLLEQIAATLPSETSPEEKERLAIGIFGVMLGTLQMARAVTDEGLSDKILESGIVAALALARTV